MKPERFALLRKILLEASDLSEEERKAYLDQACRDDPELRLQAEAILAKGAEDSAILKQAGDVPESALQPDDEAPPLPEKIGQYSINRIIASGGMGVVYEALQENPQRTVALKVMKTGIASKCALRRFEYESQLLARLTHPGIAQVYEAGTHDEGTGSVPYFAMEYVPDAKTIIEYAEEKKLGTRERLELFAQVCDAVHHGHQKGVIHRDLKPGNILVNPEGQVKVIDFGVARSTDSDVALTTLQTDVGQLIGTLQYMSPEQCAADPHDIDTRSDVYALGVVQYELLCGQLPYDVKQKAIHEVGRVIREEQPTRPSSINKQLRGDVETITLKALEKDRDRRYQSAVELAQDIRRYLSGEAIEGRPPSMVYQMQVFARRHRAVFLSLIAIFLVLAAGLAVSSTMYLRAEQAREETAQERDRALAAEQEAEKRRTEAEAVTTFLSETLAAVDPSEAQGKEVTVREMLDKAAEKIGEAFAEQPLVEATLRSTIGNTYSALGEYATAELHLEAALEIRKRGLGEDHIDTLRAMSNLGDLYFQQSRFDEAESIFTPAVEIYLTLLGEEHPETLKAMHALGAIWNQQGRSKESIELHQKILDIRLRELGEEHPDTIHSMIVLAYKYTQQGRYLEAEQLATRALELQVRLRGENHPATLEPMSCLGYLYFYWNRPEKGVTFSEKCLEIRKRVYGNEHPETIYCMNSLGADYVKLERYDEGEQLMREAAALAKRVLGDDHKTTLLYQINQGWIKERQGRYGEAEKIYQRVLEHSRDRLGNESASVMRYQLGLAGFLVRQEKYNDAEDLLKKTIRQQKRLFSDNRSLGRSLRWYGVCLLRTGRFSQAETALLESLEIFADAQAITDRLETVEYLVELYDSWGKPDEAAKWHEKLSESKSETESAQTH